MAETTSGSEGEIPYQRTEQRPPGSSAGPSAETGLWKGHPALRATFYQWILAIAITYGLFWAFPHFQAALVSGADALTLSPGQTESVLFWSHLVLALPAVIMIIKTSMRLLTSYELTSQRLIIRTGLLVRRRNEVALHRIRDYQVEKPIYWGILGIGYLLILSRDETMPNLKLGPVARPTEVIDRIREAAFAYMREMGYREFESW